MRRLQALIIALLILQSAIAHAAPEPPLAVDVSGPGLLFPGQSFSVTATVFSTSARTSAVQLAVPPWLQVEQHTPVTTSAGHPALIVYQVRVKPNTPLGARGVITFAAGGVSSSFVVMLCCKEQRAPARSVRLAVVRR